MKFIFSIILLVFHPSLFAQNIFLEHEIINDNQSIINARNVHTADLDRDGDQDIIAAGVNLSWFENKDGKGNYGEKKTIFDEFISKTFAIDIDLDGDNDILAFSDKKVIWLENINGKGKFGSPIVINNNSNPTFQSIFPIDFDNDGDIDIISNQISWFENINGVFSNEQIIVENTMASSIFGQDLDNDGDIDIVFSSRSQNQVSWIERLEKATFSEKKIISNDIVHLESLIPIDVDLDGKVDIIGINSYPYSSNTEIILFKNIDGKSFEKQFIETSDEHVDVIHPSDIDQDGDTDLVIGFNSGKTKIKILINNNGEFDSQKKITSNTRNITSLFTGDIDNDGNLDVLSSSSTDWKISWYKKTESDFVQQKSIAEQKIYAPHSIQLIDIDDDNDLDVLYNPNRHGKILWHENLDGYGQFSKQKTVSKTSKFTTFIPFDMDGDTDVDLLNIFIDSSLHTAIGWLENQDGFGSFENNKKIYSIPSAKTILPIVDINQDGQKYMIIFSYAYGVGTISLLANFMNPDKIKETVIYEGNINSIHLTDLDNDSDVDIIATSKETNTVSFFENIDGETNFKEPIVISEKVSGLRSITSSDLNHDGKLDIITGSTSGPDMHLNNGVHNFYKKSLFHSGVVNSIVIADIDSDNNQDIIFSSFNSHKEGIFISSHKNGNGSEFLTKQIVQLPVFSISTGDINGDGKLDLISDLLNKDGYSHKISWFENDISTATYNTSSENKLISYPNPTTGFVQFDNQNIEQISIFNSLGEEMMSFKNCNKINISNLQTGVYFCHISLKNGVYYSTKIIKQ